LRRLNVEKNICRVTFENVCKAEIHTHELCFLAESTSLACFVNCHNMSFLPTNLVRRQLLLWLDVISSFLLTLTYIHAICICNTLCNSLTRPIAGFTQVSTKYSTTRKVVSNFPHFSSFSEHSNFGEEFTYAPVTVPRAMNGAVCSPANQMLLPGSPSLIISISLSASSTPVRSVV